MRILRQLIGAIRKIVEFWTPSGIADRKYKWQGAGFAGDGSESEGAKSAKRYFLGLNIDEQEPELRNIIEYFKNDDNPITMFPGNFTKKYRIDYDKACKMNYVFYENKKMFFPKGWSTASIRRYYDELRMEQDEDSPHRYETKDFIVKNGDVIADIGAAEGIWALKYVEIAKKIYLFESNPAWIKALQKTFEPWKEKVVIVNKYISDVNDNTNITLDCFFENKIINFVKADIEGAEVKLVNGGQKILASQKDIKLLLATYHLKNAAEELKERLEKLEFTTEYSKGYMIVWWQNVEKETANPYIRRGVIRAKKV